MSSFFIPQGSSDSRHPSLHPERSRQQIRRMSSRAQQHTYATAVAVESESLRADPSTIRLPSPSPYSYHPASPSLPSTPHTFIPARSLSRQASRSDSMTDRLRSSISSIARRGSNASIKIREFFLPKDLTGPSTRPISSRSNQTFASVHSGRVQGQGHSRIDSAQSNGKDAFATQIEIQLAELKQEQTAAKARDRARDERARERRARARYPIDQSPQISGSNSPRVDKPLPLKPDGKMTAFLEKSKSAATETYKRKFRPTSVASEMDFADVGVVAAMECCEVCGRVPQGVEMLRMGKCADCKAFKDDMKSSKMVKNQQHVAFMVPAQRKQVEQVFYEDPGNPFAGESHAF